MATSPIYSWPEPDNTDLVKNGALAIRTLGNAIDTTMGTMVAKTVVDAKGDLIAGTAADTVNRLAVGANGETLVADSSTSTGLRYQGSTAAGKNAFINGGNDIWQRGTSFNFSGAGTPYGPDRWTMYSGNTGTVTRQVTGDTTNLPNIQYCSRIQRTAAVTSTAAFYYGQSIESVNSIPFAGKTISYSFYARAGANYSGTLQGNFLASTGTDQNYVTGAITGQTTVITTGTIALTTTWQRFTYTGTVPATATQIGQFFYYAPTGTAGAADYYEITGVQVELGSVATAFARNAGTIQGELAACQRYFNKVENPYVFTVNQSTSSTTGVIPFPVVMRVAPTATYSAASTFYVAGNSSGTASSVSTNTAKTFQLPIDFGKTGLTAWNGSFVSNNGTSTIEMSSEL